jgi:ADP-ribosylglycohydrolase
VNSTNIQYPACRVEALKERRLEARIQDQSVLAKVLNAAAKFDFKILCNYKDFKALFENLQSNVRLTHRDPFIAGRCVAFGLIVAALINGDSLKTAPKTISQQAEVHGISLSIAVPETMDADRAAVSFYDAVLQPGWSYEAARDDAVQITPPWRACRLFGLACALEFMLPAAYYFSSRFEDDFDLPVLSAINGGGNNMARASLTGALAGAQIGIRGIPRRLTAGLANYESLLEMAERVADGGKT